MFTGKVKLVKNQPTIVSRESLYQMLQPDDVKQMELMSVKDREVFWNKDHKRITVEPYGDDADKFMVVLRESVVGRDAQTWTGGMSSEGAAMRRLIESCEACVEAPVRQLQEGTWSVPFTLKQAQKLAALFEKPIPAKKAGNALYHLTGDDRLFDEFSDLESKGEGDDDVRISVAMWVRKILKAYEKDPETFRDQLDPKAKTILARLVKKFDTYGEATEAVNNPNFSNPAKAEDLLASAFGALEDLKFTFDAMDEVPNSMKDVYKQTMKAMDAVVAAKKEATQLAGMVRKSLRSESTEQSDGAIVESVVDFTTDKWPGFRVGDTLKTVDGHTIKINDAEMSVDPFGDKQMNIQFDYSYETADGSRKGHSKCQVGSMVDMIRGAGGVRKGARNESSDLHETAQYMTGEDRKRHVERFKKQYGDDHPVHYQKWIKKAALSMSGAPRHDAEGDLNDAHGGGDWFAKMSPQAQKAYLKAHPDSEYSGRQD